MYCTGVCPQCGSTVNTYGCINTSCPSKSWSHVIPTMLVVGTPSYTCDRCNDLTDLLIKIKTYLDKYYIALEPDLYTKLLDAIAR